MEEINVNVVWETSIAIIFAILGALARLLTNRSEEQKLQRYLIVSELFIAGFMGGMMILLAQASHLKGNWVGLICGAAGWIGPKIMEYIVKPAEKALSTLNPLKGLADAVDTTKEKKDG